MTKKPNKENKPKLFIDYADEWDLPSDVEVLWSKDRYAIMKMLNDLAHQIHELKEENALLRGQITELTHKMDLLKREFDHLEDDENYIKHKLLEDVEELNQKMDFVMSGITPPHQDTTRFFYENGNPTMKILKPKNLNEIYKETLKKKKKGVK